MREFDFLDPEHWVRWNSNFSFERTLERIKANGFAWEEFWVIFPFGFLGIREGEYIELVECVLDSLPTDEDRVLLLDLLDTQWCIFAEQLYRAEERGGNPDRFNFVGAAHFVFVRLKMNSDFRRQRGLPGKDASRLSLGEHETLLDRIMVPSR